jgi:hypothetical protein
MGFPLHITGCNPAEDESTDLPSPASCGGDECSASTKVAVYAALLAVLSGAAYVASGTKLDRDVTKFYDNGKSVRDCFRAGAKNVRIAYEEGDFAEACRLAAAMVAMFSEGDEALASDSNDLNMYRELAVKAERLSREDPSTLIHQLVEDARQAPTLQPGDGINTRESNLMNMLSTRGPHARQQNAAHLSRFLPESFQEDGPVPTPTQIRLAYWDAAKELATKDPAFSAILAGKAFQEVKDDPSGKQVFDGTEVERQGYSNRLALAFAEGMCRCLGTADLDGAADMASELLTLLRRMPFDIDPFTEKNLRAASDMLEKYGVTYRTEEKGKTCRILSEGIKTELSQSRGEKGQSEELASVQ